MPARRLRCVPKMPDDVRRKEDQSRVTQLGLAILPLLSLPPLRYLACSDAERFGLANPSLVYIPIIEGKHLSIFYCSCLSSRYFPSSF